MYKKFFGFTERPFKLVPNPAYLFLSKSHEVALAHLTYAVTHGDGFVEITGEVGTGKTTLCRAFLENLDEKTVSAYIFNPKLDSIQLLKSINDEFGIRSDADNTKDLIDTLNAFLIEKNAEGKNVILLIDEAQNLSESVLEQLRLLSNLETTRDKLLQIILVGQPELGEKLDSYDLRQLSQRITLSCQLIPLNYKEVRDYIQHRINIAARKPGIKFTQGAYRAIYRHSRGIPRLINIVCDRALLVAFGLDRQKISGKIAKDAVKELLSRGDIKDYRLQQWKHAFAILAVLCLVFFGVLFYHPGFRAGDKIFPPSENKKPSAVPAEPVANKTLPPKISHRDPETIISQPEKMQEPGTAPAEAQTTGTREPDIVSADIQTVKAQVPDSTYREMPSEKTLKPAMDAVPVMLEILSGMDSRSSRHFALMAALHLWKVEPEIMPYLDGTDDDSTFFRLAAKQNGLMVRRIEGDLNQVRRLNLPAILPFTIPGSPYPVYLTLYKTEGKNVALRSGKDDRVINVASEELKSYWSGTAYIPWKNFLSLTGTVPVDAPGDTIITLKMLLRDIGFNEIEINPVYDTPTQQAIIEIQEKHGILTDGLVGSSTKIVLYNEKKYFYIPHIAN
ncbi:AAA family ATPase [Thermodesulfobacteriota bacterium]